MTEYHKQNFNEDFMHMWIPDFTVDAPEQDKLWITLCYTIALNSGFNRRYEFYVHDLKAVNTLHSTDLWADFTFWNRKYGDWIKMGYVNGHKGFFMIQKENWDFVEWMVPPGIWQRKWVHIISQIFDIDGFRYHDLYEEEDETWAHLAKRANWSSINQEDAWWMNAQELSFRATQSKLKANRPIYLNAPAITAKGKRVNTKKGLRRADQTANLIEKKDEENRKLR
jgi:hypothetical protein